MDATVHGNASRRQALDYIAGHKSRLPLVVLAREARLWEVWYVDQQVSYDANVMGYGPIRLVRGTLFAYWALALGAVIGAVLWRRRGLRLYPFVVQAAVTALAAAATTGLTRFRIATDVSIVLLAAVALDAAIGAATRAHRSTGATTPDVD